MSPNKWILFYYLSSLVLFRLHYFVKNLVTFYFWFSRLLKRSTEGVFSLEFRISLTPSQYFSTVQALKGLSMSYYESLLNVKQILGTQSFLMFSIFPLLLSMSLNIFVELCGKLGQLGISNQITTSHSDLELYFISQLKYHKRYC